MIPTVEAVAAGSKTTAAVKAQRGRVTYAAHDLA